MYVLLIKDGIVANRICADSVERASQFFPDYTCLEDVPGANIGDSWDGQTFTPHPVEIVKEWDSGFSFLREFTIAEQAGIRAAAKQSTAVETFIRMAELAPRVVSTDPLTVEGMAALVGAGLLSEERRAQIMGV